MMDDEPIRPSTARRMQLTEDELEKEKDVLEQVVKEGMDRVNTVGERLSLFRSFPSFSLSLSVSLCGCMGDHLLSLSLCVGVYLLSLPLWV